jgi:hypothetical protein
MDSADFSNFIENDAITMANLQRRHSNQSKISSKKRVEINQSQQQGRSMSVVRPQKSILKQRNSITSEKEKRTFSVVDSKKQQFS